MTRSQSTIDKEELLIVARNCACSAARKLSRSLTREYDRAMKSSGLKSTQFIILVAVSLGEKAQIGTLAQRLGLERSPGTSHFLSVTDSSRQQKGAMGERELFPSPQEAAPQCARHCRCGERLRKACLMCLMCRRLSNNQMRPVAVWLNGNKRPRVVSDYLAFEFRFQMKPK